MVVLVERQKRRILLLMRCTAVLSRHRTITDRRAHMLAINSSEDFQRSVDAA